MKWFIEDGARRDTGHADAVRWQAPREDEVATSIAISLKRIADALENTDGGENLFDVFRAIADQMS